MSLLDPEELEALEAAARAPQVGGAPSRRALPLTLGRADQDVMRALGILDVQLPTVLRRLRESMRHQTRRDVDVEDSAPQARTLDELAQQTIRPVFVELGAGSGLPVGLIVIADSDARTLALSTLRAPGSDPPDEIPNGLRPTITQGECRLLARMMAFIATAIEGALPPTAPGRPIHLLGLHTDVRQLGTIDRQGLYVHLPITFKGDIRVRLELALPPSWLIRPPKTIQRRRFDGRRRRIGDDPAAIDLLLTAELGRARMTLRRLLALETGEVIPLLAAPSQPVPVLVQGKVKLKGHPEVRQGVVTIVIDGSERAAADGKRDDARAKTATHESIVDNATIVRQGG